MKNFSIALILSILIHIIFFMQLNDTNKKEIKEPLKNTENKSNIKYVKLKIETKPIPKPKTVEKKEKPKEIIKKEPTKQAEKKKTPPKPKPKKFVEKKPEPKKEIKKVKKTKEVKEKKVPKKPIIKEENTKAKELKKEPIKEVKQNTPIAKKAETPKKLSLSEFLSQPVDEEMLDEITQSYLDLYGEEYNSFTKVQKVFLKKHLRDIGEITGIYLIYPSIAAQTGQRGMNVVEFILYPNGDISDLKLIRPLGYESLDKNSIETIKTAYKDYPKPKEPTKVRIYISYIIN